MQTSEQFSPEFKEVYKIACEFSSKYGVPLEDVMDMMTHYGIDGVPADIIRELCSHFNKPIEVVAKDNIVKLNRSSYLLIGSTGEGKSTLINKLSGEEVVKEGSGVESETSSVSIHEIPEFNIYAIDTPGFCDTREQLSKSPERIMKDVTQISKLQMKRESQVRAILFLWNPVDNSKLRIVPILQSLCESFGENVHKSIVLVINKRTEFWGSKLISDRLKNFYTELDKKPWKIPCVEVDIKEESKEQVFEKIQAGVNKAVPYNEKDFEAHRKRFFYKRFQKKVKEEKATRTRIEAVKKDLASEFKNQTDQLIEKSKTEITKLKEELEKKGNEEKEEMQRIIQEMKAANDEEKTAKDAKLEEVKRAYEKKLQEQYDRLKQDISLLNNKLAEQQRVAKEAMDKLKESQKVVNGLPSNTVAVVNNAQPQQQVQQIQQVQQVQPVTQVAFQKPDQTVLVKMDQKLKDQWGNIFIFSGIGTEFVSITAINSKWIDDVMFKRVIQDITDSFRENYIAPFKRLHYMENEGRASIYLTVRPGQNFPALQSLAINLPHSIVVNNYLSSYISQLSQSPLSDLVLSLCLSVNKELWLQISQNLSSLKSFKFDVPWNSCLTDLDISNFASKITQNLKGLQTLLFNYPQTGRITGVGLCGFTTEIARNLKSLQHFSLLRTTSKSAVAKKEELLGMITQITTNLKDLKELHLDLIGLIEEDVLTVVAQIAQNLRSLDHLTLNFGGNFVTNLTLAQTLKVKELLEYIPKKTIHL